MLVLCKICHSEFKNQHSLSRHVNVHHKLSKREYYDEYVKSENEGLCLECGKDTSFRGTKYLTFCSHKCYSGNTATRAYRSKLSKGIKQSKETIQKRISNTDQSKKEARRVSTMLRQYGSLSTYGVMSEENQKSRNKKLSESLTGRKHTKEHHEKVINSKRKNGTLKHPRTTREKMSLSHKNNYASDNPPMSLSTSSKNGKGYKTGFVNKIFYRSSYEKTFLEYCAANAIKVQSAETKEFRSKYINEIDGTRKMYYPDFYLVDYDIIVEIKPLSMLTVNNNLEKLNAGMSNCPMALVTEEELDDLDAFFEGIS